MKKNNFCKLWKSPERCDAASLWVDGKGIQAALKPVQQQVQRGSMVIENIRTDANQLTDTNPKDIERLHTIATSHIATPRGKCVMYSMFTQGNGRFVVNLAPNGYIFQSSQFYFITARTPR